MPRFTPKAETEEKERKALELRRAGVDYATIARQLGYSNRGTVHRMVQKAMARVNKEPAEALRNLEQERLDRLQAAVWQDALKGSYGAVDRVIRIMERRAKLLGLDAPTAITNEVTGEITVQFGFPRPDPREADARAIPQAQLHALPGGSDT